MEKRYAVLAGTPYTLFNILNFVENTIDKNSVVDLYVRSMPMTESYISKIKSKRLFNDVYTFKLRPKEHSIGYYFYDLRQAVFPAMFLEEIIQEPINLNDKNYDVITITSGFEVEMALVRVFPTAAQVAIEDGLGSYIGDIVHDHRLKWIWRVLGRRTELIQPEILYVNNKDACKSTLTHNIENLMNLDDCSETFQKLINEIFQCKNTELYAKADLIYLTQPVEDLAINREQVNSIMEEVFIISKDRLLVRKHPRDTGYYKQNIKQDEKLSLWEMICKYYVHDDKCLIGICSTAQIMPKMLFNYEPTIIFTYKLFNWKQKIGAYELFEKVEQMIRDLYKNKERVFAPKTTSELQEFLGEYLYYEK